MTIERINFCLFGRLDGNSEWITITFLSTAIATRGDDSNKPSFELKLSVHL